MTSDTIYHIRCSIARCVVLAGLVVAGFAGMLGAQEVRDTLPPGVTTAMIERGAEVFRGSARCHACHGAGGIGTEAGPDLTDEVWFHGRGTYEDILERVLHGVSRRESKTGGVMPMRGWDPASDTDVRAVAAYVWSLRKRR
ncbi:MAG: cytochrome c [Gemmatimonadota bacterium]|nr:cytochrome c [Gemmatimonadota bacterium]